MILVSPQPIELGFTMRRPVLVLVYIDINHACSGSAFCFTVFLLTFRYRIHSSDSIAQLSCENKGADVRTSFRTGHESGIGFARDLGTNNRLQTLDLGTEGGAMYANKFNNMVSPRPRP